MTVRLIEILQHSALSVGQVLLECTGADCETVVSFQEGADVIGIANPVLSVFQVYEDQCNDSSEVVQANNLEVEVAADELSMDDELLDTIMPSPVLVGRRS